MLVAAAFTCWLLQLHLVLGRALCCCSLSQPLRILLLTLGVRILHPSHIHQAQPLSDALAMGTCLQVPHISMESPPPCATDSTCMQPMQAAPHRSADSPRPDRQKTNV